MEQQLTETLQPTPALWQTPRWYYALTLSERIATLRPENVISSLEDGGRRERAEKKMRQWKEQYPFDKESYFADRLAQDALGEQELLALLAEPIEALQARSLSLEPPDWLARLTQIFSGDTAAADIPFSLQDAGENQEAYSLLQPFSPLLQDGRERLQAGIAELVQAHHALPFDPQAAFALLFPNLAQQILPEVKRALVLELNVARLRGRLPGETPQERFQGYLLFLRQRENLVSFLEEYCILARHILQAVDLWVAFSLEFLRHLCADWESIQDLFSPDQHPGLLVKASAGAGDTHRQGRSVMLLKFQAGLQLVYKPRSLAVDRHFQDLLSWLNEHGQRPAFRTLRLIDRETYGWTEFVVASECTSEEEVVRFYERQGAYLALLYALKAVDFHAENIIAAGEDPMLVDLEALFHPDVRVKLSMAERPATRAVASSVMSIALLPQRFWSNDQHEGVDMSGLGNAQGQLSPHAVPIWQGVGTDEMKIIRERVTLSGHMNCPKLHGQYVQAANYIGSIVTGFTSLYHLLCEMREEVLNDILTRFAHDEIRFIARATRTYGALSVESFHPNMLRDALKRERLFDRLWMAVKQQPYLTRLIPAEREDLLQGDIPLFTTSPGSCDLFTSQGQRIPNFFDQPSLRMARERIQSLDEPDLRRQIWMIQAAFASVALPASDAPAETALPQSVDASVEHTRLVSAAQAIGDQLCKSALWHENAADWYGLTWVKEREWRVAPTGLDLQSGLPGIILFLSYLGTFTRDLRYIALAKSAAQTLRGELEQLKAHLDLASIGGMGISNMLGSCIYLFSHLAVLWHEPAWLDEAEALVDLLSEHIEKDDMFDIAEGAAGCIASLLSLYAVAPSFRTLAAAISCGDHLLASAQAMEQGITWGTSRHPGFGRGTTGIAWSLLRLAAVSGEKRFHEAALAALAYERSAKPGAAGLRAMSWSYGAPGSALSRIASLPHIDDNTIREEIAADLQTTIDAGFAYHHDHIGPNHSLYHGDCGNLETILLATRQLDPEPYREHLERLTAQLLDSIDTHGWRMGVPLNVETPGLMMGLSGIGYQLLRLAEPEHIPSVLTLAPPPDGL
ncbi:hypothetical protein KDH_71400 [Dictyobacter sp. S3.2.2.5]|uniref:Lantibiotic biosynthesis protein dehydration domain-containing protein n=1 Tax=Dictyobacter halimunensis TaxID=3026934 RepID=A0ABQ6G673_9CHLR|nr:hypothetical protein KDH_71400 [Dictyobacter sp. S3.2.2.5]